MLTRATLIQGRPGFLPGGCRECESRRGWSSVAIYVNEAINVMVDTRSHRGRGGAGMTIASSVAVVNTLVCGASVPFAVAD
jgi:hypothetical protein